MQDVVQVENGAKCQIRFSSFMSSDYKQSFENEAKFWLNVNSCLIEKEFKGETGKGEQVESQIQFVERRLFSPCSLCASTGWYVFRMCLGRE